MSGSSTVALFALIAMVILYAIEGSVPLATLGFAAACLIASASEFALGQWPFAVVGVGFALVAAQRWNAGRRRSNHA
jgi:hypothetical protein